LSDRIIANVDVVTALIRRDIHSRFADNFLGFGWTYVAPLVWVAATYFAFYLFGRTVPVYTDAITFIIAGLMPYMGFRYVVNSATRTNSTLRRLLIFPTVRLEHGVASASLLEWVNIFLVSAVVMGLNLLVLGNGELSDPLLWAAGMTLACALGASYGYLFVALAEVNPGFRQVGLVLLRPAFFVSGIFFTANELPDRVLWIFMLNPLLHAVEIARDGMLFHYDSRVSSALYPLAWILGMAAIAVAIRATQRS
jgi:capsular polysaccharide transport system permease protein